MASTSSTPSEITGGCLCGSVRYQITIPSGHDFTNSSSTCQCSQCRRSTGSLYFQQHTFPYKTVTWTSGSTLKNYYATPGIARGFCSDCGCFLYWRRESGENASMAVGCFDKEVLKQWGELFCKAGEHLWCDDEIPGATDHLKGKKWRFDNEGEDAELL
ncbi:Fc.00g041310.m01.CDS01 [Cosmosporella sp. VM-42]